MAKHGVTVKMRGPLLQGQAPTIMRDTIQDTIRDLVLSAWDTPDDPPPPPIEPAFV